MDIRDRVVVVTGAAGGIGRALAKAFAERGARKVVCTDLHGPDVESVARSIDGIGIAADLRNEAEVAQLIVDVEDQTGGIDIFCSNAGILTLGGVEASDADWQKTWEINVMSHIWAARHVVPRMIERGGGYLLNTASAAGLLNQIGAAPYGVTKHAAIGLAEWLHITYRDQGIGVSVLCPQAVQTDMIRGNEASIASLNGIIEPEIVAKFCMEAIEKEEFLVLPHPQVRDYVALKGTDYERWLSGMRKLKRQFER
ncbi:SDR family NAD(P)-dependent oxidoreductase [Ruegeria hyattellae]|uniref:SDR family NAD(P)-dependent oxidoreductase n=1 Tax=Ruegeria hyattellae TaxID=3233337 RepID=UPI00355B0B8C